MFRALAFGDKHQESLVQTVHIAHSDAEILYHRHHLGANQVPALLIKENWNPIRPWGAFPIETLNDDSDGTDEVKDSDDKGNGDSDDEDKNTHI